MLFFLISHSDFSKFRAEIRNMHVHTEASLQPPPGLGSGGPFAGGLEAGRDGEGWVTSTGDCKAGQQEA